MTLLSTREGSSENKVDDVKREEDVVVEVVTASENVEK
jgi:hypothetical protein